MRFPWNYQGPAWPRVFCMFTHWSFQGCTDAANKLAALLHAAQLEVAEEDFDYYRKSVISIVSDQGRRNKEMTSAAKWEG